MCQFRECSKHSEGQYENKEKVKKCWINFLECFLPSQTCFGLDLNVFATHWKTFLKVSKNITFLAYQKLYWICKAKNGQKRILPKFRRIDFFSIFKIWWYRLKLVKTHPLELFRISYDVSKHHIRKTPLGFCRLMKSATFRGLLELQNVFDPFL